MFELWNNTLISALIGSVVAILTELIISWVKRFTIFPKIRIYKHLSKDNSKNYYFKYYSKVYNKDLLIVRLNVVNFSTADGKLFDVKLFQKNNFHGSLFTKPLGLSFIEQDEILYSFLQTEKFSDDEFFVNDLKLEGKDHKNIYLIFDATNYLHYNFSDKFTLFYHYSTRKLKTKKFKFDVPSSCSTKHYKTSEILEFKKEFQNK